MFYTCVFQTFAKGIWSSQILSPAFSLSWVSSWKELFHTAVSEVIWDERLHWRETCFKRHKVTPLGALLSEIGSKENNRSYSSRLWAQVQTQTIALDQTRALSWNRARFRKKNWLQIETWASELRACLNTCFSLYDSLHFVQTAYRQAAAGCCWVHRVMC